MSARTRNPGEQDVLWMSEEYEKLVYELLDQAAPIQPWWSVKLTEDEQLFRYLDVREPIINWLSEVAVHMGWRSSAEMLEKVDDVWLTMTPIDVLPLEVTDRLPRSLLMLVQAGPYEAGDYIRKMERIFARRMNSVISLETKAAAVAPPPDLSEVIGSVLTSGGARPAR